MLEGIKDISGRQEARTMADPMLVECPSSLLATAANCRAITVAVANATTPSVLQSVRAAVELKLINPILVGRHDDVWDAAAAIDWDISGCHIEHAGEERQAAAVAVTLAASGDANAIMKGNIHTDILMRAVVDRHAGLRIGRRMSHAFHMTVPGNDRALWITDAVLNVQPSLEHKAQILKNVISLTLALGYENPRIAILSASETELAAMPSTVDAAELSRRAKCGAFSRAFVDGPLAFDVAISSEAARIKGIDSPVAGKADVVLVPNIETGNALFKSMTHFMGAAAAGIVLGSKVPIVLTSRADSVASRLASLALATIYSNSNSPTLSDGLL